MENIDLPIVPFGKYKDKPVLELMADVKYVEWLKQQAWFSQNHKNIYNIIVNQTIQPNVNAKTPEHNKLQNLFLDKNNVIKLLAKIYDNKIIDYENSLNSLFNDEDFIKNIGKIPMPCFKRTAPNVIFEAEYNWDLTMYYMDECTIKFDIKSDKEDIINMKNKSYEDYITSIDEKLKWYDKAIQIREVIDKDLPTWDKSNNTKKLKQEHIDELNCNSLESKCELIKLSENLKKIKNTDKLENQNNWEQSPQHKEFINQLKTFKSKYHSIFEKYQIDKYVNIEFDKYLQYIKFWKSYWNRGIYCELKPSLSDDYPCVLRKMKTQKQLSKFGNEDLAILIIGTFTSVAASQEQLITIFNQSDIKVIFVNEFQSGEISLSIEQKLLNAEEKIKQLENEILLLKS